MYTLPTVSESYSRQVLTLHTDTFYQKKKKENGKLQRIGVFTLLLALCKARKKYLTATLVSLVTVFLALGF